MTCFGFKEDKEGYFCIGAIGDEAEGGKYSIHGAGYWHFNECEKAEVDAYWAEYYYEAAEVEEEYYYYETYYYDDYYYEDYYYYEYYYAEPDYYYDYYGDYGYDAY